MLRFDLPRSDTPELLDAPGLADALVAANLADIARVNRWLGGSLLARLALAELLADRPLGSGLALLDVATGSADIPRALRAWLARRFGLVTVVATDLSPQILRLAGHTPGVNLAAADGMQLPFADRSFDLVACSLAVHHFAPAEAVALLRELGRVARAGVLVNDLVRSRLGYLGARLLGNALSSNPLTRHDGPLSVRRAYTRAELLELARSAGLVQVRISHDLGYRVALVARR
jgi:ubiquinone/menaquinone biosynthesis C-methylase UbiE